MSRGSIRQRGKAWELRAYGGTDPTTGRERRVSRTFHGTRTEANRALTSLLAELDAGGHRGPTGATFGDLLSEWRDLKVRSWSPKNALETDGNIRRWIAPPEESDRWRWTPGRLPLRDVTTRALDEWHIRMLEELAPPTVQRIAGIAHAALEQGVKWDWLTRNPASRCEPISGQSPEVDPPSADDLRRMLEYLNEHEQMLFLVVRLAAVTGRRRGELCALRWTDFDAESASLRVARTIVQSGDGWVERPITKNRKRFPPMALDLDTRDMLSVHRESQDEMVRLLGETPKDDDFVFLTLGRTRDQLGPWSPGAVTRRFARARVGAKVPESMQLKDLRHHVATSLIDAGVSLTTIASRLGHGGGGRLTQTVYGHMVPASDRASAEILARLLTVTAD